MRRTQRDPSIASALRCGAMLTFLALYGPDSWFGWLHPLDIEGFRISIALVAEA